MLRLGKAREDALDFYFSKRPPAVREVDAVVSAALGGGMHVATDLVTQKKHKARVNGVFVFCIYIYMYFLFCLLRRDGQYFVSVYCAC